jgi:hypothetical protein
MDKYFNNTRFIDFYPGKDPDCFTLDYSTVTGESGSINLFLDDSRNLADVLKGIIASLNEDLEELSE